MFLFLFIWVYYLSNNMWRWKMTNMISAANTSSMVLKTVPQKTNSQSSEEATESQATKAIEDTASISPAAQRAYAAENEVN